MARARRKKTETEYEFNVRVEKGKIIEDMKRLGTHKPEYESIINVYADLLVQYADANKKFAESDCAYETSTGAGGTKKSAIVATLESLRKDILAYSDRLCLNPKAVESVTTEQTKRSGLADILKNFDG
ncbi:P27 family phage terminase small subunit [Acetobacterium sp.]|uniref:P27 family phage terminase small subunit n=1 Tax=Acetobacterium sp. TaxID=1872094 RepID=UPI00271BACA6|nr:P27 family phage terminase small subunit [Acetobacterium sp.]MDO9491434.1 P27 family phage terminase small subunit [Acetobacterium sp.]